MSLAEMHKVWQTLDLFHTEDMTSGDMQEFLNPVWVFYRLESTDDMRALIRESNGHYYALEAVFRGWLFQSLSEDTAPADAAREFLTALTDEYPEQTTRKAV